MFTTDNPFYQDLYEGLNDTLTQREKNASMDGSAVLQGFWIVMLVLLIFWACVASVVACQEFCKVKTKVINCAKVWRYQRASRTPRASPEY